MAACRKYYLTRLANTNLEKRSIFSGFLTINHKAPLRDGGRMIFPLANARRRLPSLLNYQQQ